MSKFEESNFYKALQDFFINADKKTFLQFLAEFYNRTESIIDKNNIQDDLIKELRELYLELNEKGIDENIVREKVNYFLENSTKIKNINSQLDTIEKNKTSINILELGAKSSNVIFNETSNIYKMNDISSIVNIAIEKGYSEIIIPEGNYLIDTEITFNRTVTIKGYNTNIYTSPTVNTTPKTIFNINAPNVRIEGINFISVNKYKNNINASDAKGLTSNVCALAFDNTKDCVIDNCSGYGLTYFSSIMNSNNILITNCIIKECYFGIYTGFGAKKINIENTIIECQVETDKYGHAFYFAYDSDSINVNNCRLFNSGVEGCNIIKVGSNEGHATNIKVNNCSIDGIIKYNLFYLHKGSNLEINNCNININCPGGYGRVFQYGSDSMCLINNTVLKLDGFDRFSTEFISNNSMLKLNSSSLYISNKIEPYSTLPFVCGAKLIFENCLIDYSGTNRGGNLMDSAMNHFELYNCKLILNSGTTLGLWSGEEITYTKTTTPTCIMVNTVIDKKNNTSNTPFFGYIKNSAYTPIVLFSNITCIDCESKGGNNQGKLSYDGAMSDYNSYNNVVNVKFV